jgi:hypothetical protein
MAEVVTVKVIFFGLSMLVPDAGARPDGMTVLMPDTAVQQFASDGCRIPQHEPVILVKNATLVDPCNLEPALEDPDFLPNLGYLGGWKLRGSEVRWSVREGFPSPFSLEPKESGRRDSWPDTPGDRDAFDWIWKGSTSFQQRGIDWSCLKGGAHICPISARVLVSQGRVKTCRFGAVDLEEHYGHNSRSQAGHKRCQGFQGRDQSNGSTMMRRSWPLPTGASTSFEIKDTGSVTFYRRSLVPSDPAMWKEEPILELKPVKGPNGKFGAITIWVGSMPLQRHAPESEYCHRHDRDRHFEFFYLLAARDPHATKPLRAEKRQVPIATGRRMSQREQEIQPVEVCELPELFSQGVGGVPELSGVCGVGGGKPPGGP